MKVITKYVNIENEEFALIYDEQQGRKFYGTIPYTELDERGCMKRALNGFQMCIADTPAEAITLREQSIKFRRFCEEATRTPEEKLAFLTATMNA